MTSAMSMGLRAASLAGKLALSLFMAKFFSLAELGRYGLAFGAVMLAVVAFGFRIDYVLSREVLGLDRRESQRIGTTVLWIFLISFAAAAPLALWALLSAGDTGSSAIYLVLVYVLCCVESYANFLYTTTIALKRATLANALFFMRSGLWTAPAILISYLVPSLRTVGFVLVCWLAGVSLSVILNQWFTRERLLGRFGWFGLAWSEAKAFIRRALLVWIGSVGLTLGAYVDRFVLATYMTLSDVGVATFYLSFATSVITLVQSATTSVTFPILIEHYDKGDHRRYGKELRKTTMIAAVLAAAILVPLAVAMPFIARAMDKPALVASYPAFVVLLAATWLRINAETLYYALFVHRQHREIWLGNLLFLFVAFGLNMALIPSFGLTGLAISALIAALGLLAWRGLFAARHRPGSRSDQPPCLGIDEGAAE
ncbi:MAG: lipopolysaccharide biosynthesis protein [Sphingomicrobium sp.]